MEKEPQDPKSSEELNELSRVFTDSGVPMSAEDLGRADRVGFHVGYIKNDKGEIEYTKPLPHVDFGKRSGSSLPFQTVTPALIRHSRSNIPKRNYEGIFVFSDAQIGYRRVNGVLTPLHHEPSILAAQKLANDLRPNYVIDAGDTTDFAELSKYPVDSDHFQGTLQPSLQRTHDMYAEFTAATPKAERYAVDSNHAKRLGDYVLRNAFALYNVTAPNDKYPTLSYPGIVKMDEVDWNFIGGYGAAEYRHQDKDDLVVIHGTDAVSQGSTAAKLAKKNYGRNIIQGHAHRMESQYHTDRYGKIFGAFVVGALCRLDGVVPSYHSSIDEKSQPVTRYENWQNGVMYVRDYGEGKFQFDHIPIIDGIIFYNGRIYDGTTS